MDVDLNEYEVTVLLKKEYEVSRVVKAPNEYEATIMMSEFLKKT